MNAQEYVAYLNSPTGRFALGEAAKILSVNDPEIDDRTLLDKVKALGFPEWAALRVFYHCTARFAPIICRDCEKEFRPRSIMTIDRPYCYPCFRGPYSEHEETQRRAHRAARRAEETGRIKRHPCESCGTDRDLHMHHPDYSRPLFVQWLCVRCHGAEHKRLRAEAAPERGNLEMVAQRFDIRIKK